ncbi:MAG: hypothetical protein JWO80_5370 [Bryobacterales bacterium]|nr:hypothetical protein [Bryobacterales bacterium]
MKTNRAKWFFAALGLCAILLPAGAARADTISFRISVDTSSLSASSGYLDFQFNPSNTPFDPATVTLVNFLSDGTLTGALADIGDVNGTLPGTVVIGNTAGLNDHTEGFTFGSFFDIFVTLDTPSVSGTAAGGSTFALGVLASDGITPALAGDPLVQINLDATTGNPSITNNSPGGEAVVTSTPEPGSPLLVATGLMALVGGWRQIRERKLSNVARS